VSINLDRIKARLARVRDKWPTEGTRAPGADEFGPKAWAAHGPLRCHASEGGRGRQWRQALHDADFISAAPEDIAALVTEVERLRGEVAEERAAVVAYLRGEPERLVECDGRRHADGKPCLVMSPMPADELADDIERGEHRREED